VSQGCDGARIGLGQVVGDDEAVRGGRAGVEVRRGQAEDRGGRGAEDLEPGLDGFPGSVAITGMVQDPARRADRRARRLQDRVRARPGGRK